MSSNEYTFTSVPSGFSWVSSTGGGSTSGNSQLVGSSGSAGQAVLVGTSGSGASQGVLIGSSGSAAGSSQGLLVGSSGSAGSGQTLLVGSGAGQSVSYSSGGAGQSVSYSSGGAGQSVSYSSGGAGESTTTTVRFVEPVQFTNVVQQSVSLSSAVSEIENAILSSSNPIAIQETEVITVNGETGIWSNKSEVVNWRGVIPITEYQIFQDSNPEIIRKRTQQELVYEQEVAIRYLRPPTPPPPGEIIIRQEKNIVTPPAPPLVIRQQPPRPETPPPMVVREAPPRPPASVGQKVITISGKRLPPPPRKVIIERLAPLPSKPQALLIERWLPYSQQKRRVIFQRNDVPDPVVQRPRNVIIQWEAPQVSIRKEFKDLGVIRANPVEYVQRYGASLKTANELPEVVREIRPAAGIVLAAEFQASSVYELEGDIQALSLVDLDREGLSEYRRYVISGGSSGSFGSVVSGGSFGGSTSGSSTVTIVSGGNSQDAALAELFASVDRNADGRLSLEEAQRLLLKFNSRLGRSYTENDARVFLTALDTNRSGFIEFDEFRRALVRQFA